MKEINTIDAVGHVLCHDITQIIKDVTKGTAFSKGHIITEADIPVLLSLGKEHLYVWEKQEGMLHENEAAEILYQICAGEHMSPTAVKEGKIEVIADVDGLLEIDIQKLRDINSIGNMMIATRHTNFPVKKGDKLAGTRIIPLIIEAKQMENAKMIGGNQPILKINPYKHKKVAIVTTGTEVYKGLIKDTFTPVLKEKISEYDAELIGHIILGDNPEEVTAAILNFVENGADIVLCSGGMSVDPDDKTPLAIKNTGARIISYGAPVLPGAMFMLAYMENGSAIMGLPGCVMYAKRTIFDLVLPKIMSDVNVTDKALYALGHGGFCLNCEHCTFPNCSFGAGV